MTNGRWDPEDLAASWESPPGLGRCIVIGSTIGVVASFAGVLALGLAGGLGPGTIGLAAFVAFWGGLGFGSMMGGVTYGMGLERAEHGEVATDEVVLDT